MNLRETLGRNEQLLLPEYTLIDEVPRSAHAVLIRDGVFADVGPADVLQQRHPQLAPTVLPRRLLMPGFIDTHHHLTQAYGKALAFGEPSEIFRRIWVPLEQHLDGRDLQLSSQLACLEALRGGFTTVCDAGTRSDAGLEAIEAAVRATGIRCVLARTCNDAGVEAAGAQAIVRAAEQHLSASRTSDLIHASLAISIPEAGSDTMLAHIARMCREAGAVFQVHVNEHLASIERSLIARGRRPLEVLLHAGALGPELLAAHATMLTPSELMLLRDSGAAVSYNPVASSWKGNAVAAALQMQAMGIRVGLGTDGTRGDAFRLMDAAETAQRLAFGLPSGDFSCGAGWTWLAMATGRGADACRLTHTTGRVAQGLAADCLLVDLDVPELTPSWDLGWEMVRLAGRSQIEAVLVQGRLRLWQGWPVDWDARALMDEVRERSQAAVSAAPIQRVHRPSSQIRDELG